MTVSYNHHQELEHLQQSLITMGKAVACSMDEAVCSLIGQDVKLAGKVIEFDDHIDQMEAKIEDKCMALIGGQALTALDQRIIGTGLKVTTDLERIGDHAYDIARITLTIAEQPFIKPLVDIPEMAKLAQEMLKDALIAYTTHDIALTEAVRIRGVEVASIYSRVFRDLLTYMMEDSQNITQAAQLIFVACYLARIANHATNIAEWALYLVTGQRCKKNKSDAI